jgi:hypothetical protein
VKYFKTLPNITFGAMEMFNDFDTPKKYIEARTQVLHVLPVEGY